MFFFLLVFHLHRIVSKEVCHFHHFPLLLFLPLRPNHIRCLCAESRVYVLKMFEQYRATQTHQQHWHAYRNFSDNNLNRMKKKKKKKKRRNKQKEHQIYTAKRPRSEFFKYYTLIRTSFRFYTHNKLIEFSNNNIIIVIILN